MKLTFLDSGVLILLATAVTEQAQRAYDILNDPERGFVSSSLVEMEVLPKAVYHKNDMEADIYRAFFSRLDKRVPVNEQLLERALLRASRLGLNALDAIHLEAAIVAGAVEFITTERTSKPLFRESEIQVISVA